MLNWLHGIAFTLSFYFLADGNPTAVSLIPIFISCCLSVLASIQYLREKRNASLQLATTATATLMLILFFTQPDHIYEIFAATFAVICLLFVFANAHVIFFLAPKWLALANSISFLLTAVLYVLFYASIKKHILDQSVYIPLVLLFFVEIFILVRIQNLKDGGLSDDKIQELRSDRMTYDISLLIAIGATIAYTIDAVTLKTNIMVCLISNIFGFVVSLYIHYKDIYNGNYKSYSFLDLARQESEEV